MRVPDLPVQRAPVIQGLLEGEHTVHNPRGVTRRTAYARVHGPRSGHAGQWPAAKGLAGSRGRLLYGRLPAPAGWQLAQALVYFDCICGIIICAIPRV
jgi:hypothetical protein